MMTLDIPSCLASSSQNSMPSVPSNAVPAMLKWARESMNFSLEDVALAERIDAKKLADWESGIKSPTLYQLSKLAKRYKRPTMVFYLAEPPIGFSVVRDFRLLPEGEDREFSPALSYAIRVAQERQAWASSYLEDEGFAPVTNLKSAKTSDDPAQVGRDLREALRLTVEMRRECATELAAFTLLKRLVERAGIFVFQAVGVPVKEMRGFALPDRFAPAVVVNSKDYPRPKSFTLAHEVAHILLGEPAVSGAGSYAFAIAKDNATERFCNQVAAEVLMPESDFRPRVPSDWESRRDVVIARFMRRYWVSADAIRLRFVELGFAPQSFFSDNRIAFTPTAKPKKEMKIPPYRIAISRCGEAFARTAIAAYKEGSIHGGALTSLLSMKLKHLRAMEGDLFPGRVPTTPSE